MEGTAFFYSRGDAGHLQDQSDDESALGDGLSLRDIREHNPVTRAGDFFAGGG